MKKVKNLKLTKIEDKPKLSYNEIYANGYEAMYTELGYINLVTAEIKAYLKQYTDIGDMKLLDAISNNCKEIKRYSNIILGYIDLIKYTLENGGK